MPRIERDTFEMQVPIILLVITASLTSGHRGTPFNGLTPFKLVPNVCPLDWGGISCQAVKNPAFQINKVIKEKQRVVPLMRRLALQPPVGSFIVSYNPWLIQLGC